MFKKKTKFYKEIEEDTIKKLKLFEQVYGNYNELGHEVYYIRVPGGIIRTIITPEAVNQVFIALPNTYFI